MYSVLETERKTRQRTHAKFTYFHPICRNEYAKNHGILKLDTHSYAVNMQIMLYMRTMFDLIVFKWAMSLQNLLSKIRRGIYAGFASLN